MIRVAILADSPVLRSGLANVFAAQPDIEVVGVDGADVVIDANREHANADAERVFVAAQRGDDAVHAGRAPSIVLLERMDGTVARDAFTDGAAAVLAVDARDAEVVAAVRAVAAGLVVMPQALMNEVMSDAAMTSMDAAADSSRQVSLTNREGQVLGLLAQGYANKVIAVRLGITDHTVKTHIAAVYDKLGARNRAEAVVAAARLGLVAL